MELKTLHYVYWTSLITSLETLHELSKGPRWVYGKMNLGVTIFGQSPPPPMSLVAPSSCPVSRRVSWQVKLVSSVSEILCRPQPPPTQAVLP